MDELTAAVQARTQTFLEDMVHTNLPLTEHSLGILADIIEIMHAQITFDYLLDTLALHQLREIMTTPKGTLQ